MSFLHRLFLVHCDMKLTFRLIQVIIGLGRVILKTGVIEKGG